jgi:hypothetical protein
MGCSDQGHLSIFGILEHGFVFSALCKIFSGNTTTEIDLFAKPFGAKFKHMPIFVQLHLRNCRLHSKQERLGFIESPDSTRLVSFGGHPNDRAQLV